MTITTMTTALTAAPGCPARPSVSTREARRSAATPVRLTRRGRMLVVLLLLGLLLAAGFAVGRVSNSRADPAVTRTAVVQPGDTLWSIAARVEPGRDTRVVVSQIRAVNHLANASVQVGQRLLLPA